MIRLIRYSTLTIGIALVAALGCSQGSGHKFTPMGLPGGTGALSSALPTASRANSYAFQPTVLNTFQSGEVTALAAAASVGTDTLAAHGPGGTIALFANNVATDEANLTMLVSLNSIASTNSGTELVFASSSDKDIAGVGDVYRRVGATWNNVLDTTHNEAHVSAVGSFVYALAGSETLNGEVHVYDTAANVFSQVATIQSTIPMAAADFGNEIWVAGMDSGSGGGAAKLYRLTAAGPVEVTIPGASGGNNVRQEIAGLMTYTYGPVSGGSTATPAVIGYDSHIAPILQARCTACHASTAIVGADMLLSSVTAQNDYAVVLAQTNAAVPANSDILLQATSTGAVPHTGGALLTVGDADYQTILSWIQDGTPQTGSVASSGNGAVSGQLLIMALASYARDSGQALGGAVLLSNGLDWETLVGFGGDAPTGLTMMDNTLYTSTSNGRLLYRNSTGGWVDEPDLPTNTGIGAILGRDADHLYIGASTTNGAEVFVRTVLAAAPLNVSYTADVAPILAANCAACHAVDAIVMGAMPLSDNTAVNDYGVVLSTVNVADPASSLLLTKSTNAVVHTGGALLTVGDPNYNMLLGWIQANAPN